jgi:bacteriorhodopsin
LFFLELFVQIIEALFYIWLAYNFKKLSNMTPNRYMDWVVTTPTMLITLISYLIFLEAKVTKQTSTLRLTSILKANYKTLVPILSLNWMMLLFGYLGEIKVIPIVYSVALGFIPFLIYYYMIYKNFVANNKSTTGSGLNLFMYFFFFWSLYGVAAFMPYYIKNISYNILDLFSKNFFGILLAYIIYTGSY